MMIVHKNVISLILIILFLTTGFVTSGCSWMGILDTNPYDDTPADHEQYREQKIEEIRQDLLGLSKDEVLKKLGKPSRINNLGDNYQSPTKFRENQWVFDGAKKCLMSECGPIFVDESWAYIWERRTKQYYSQIGFGVFFKNGIVMLVE